MWLGGRQHEIDAVAGKVSGQGPPILQFFFAPHLILELPFADWLQLLAPLPFHRACRAIDHYWRGGNGDGSASAGQHDRRGPIVISEWPIPIAGGPGLGAQLVCVMPRRHAERMVTMHMNCNHAGTKEVGMHWFRNWTVDEGRYDEVAGRNASLAMYPDW